MRFFGGSLLGCREHPQLTEDDLQNVLIYGLWQTGESPEPSKVFSAYVRAVVDSDAATFFVVPTHAVEVPTGQ
jgi:ABC-type branched-subunit amino acid transport system substrate-binding protein